MIRLRRVIFIFDDGAWRSHAQLTDDAELGAYGRRNVAKISSPMRKVISVMAPPKKAWSPYFRPLISCSLKAGLHALSPS